MADDDEMIDCFTEALLCAGRTYTEGPLLLQLLLVAFGSEGLQPLPPSRTHSDYSKHGAGGDAGEPGCSG
jgi:hypothetical protein|eukprot:COSAG01_NODE_8591_length_2725_cov_55.670602_3_plen_70_part_00